MYMYVTERMKKKYETLLRELCSAFRVGSMVAIYYFDNRNFSEFYY